jgi:hypothetical protein
MVRLWTSAIEKRFMDNENIFEKYILFWIKAGIVAAKQHSRLRKQKEILEFFRSRRSSGNFCVAPVLDPHVLKYAAVLCSIGS